MEQYTVPGVDQCRLAAPNDVQFTIKLAQASAIAWYFCVMVLYSDNTAVVTTII